MKLHILAIVSHPDDAELMFGGTLAKHAALGFKTGVIDLTHGEMGTRGTPQIRLEEAKAASEILGLSIRENMGFRDVYFTDDDAHRIPLIEKIRQYQPDIILTNAPEDRHPDHGRACHMVKTAAWLSGLVKIETSMNSVPQQAWRPKHIYHGIQYNVLTPDFVVDISGYTEVKMKAVMAYRSQFYDEGNKEPATLISSQSFIDLIAGKNTEAGNRAMRPYAEGFIAVYTPAVDDFFKLI